jgi:hypothetical protein
MVSRGRRLAAVVGVVALAGTMAACNKQSQKCDSQSGQGAGCTITTTGKGSSVELGFILNPEKDRNDFSDHYLFNGSKDGVASFSAMRQDFTCRQGETIPVGRGFADCLEVGEDHFKVRIYVGDPPRQ